MNCDIPFGTGIFSALVYISLFVLAGYAIRAEASREMSPVIFYTYFLLLGWACVGLARGFMEASGYLDYKMLLLGTGPFVMVTMALFVGLRTDCVHDVLSFLLRVQLLFGFLFIPLSLELCDELYSRLMIPSWLLILLLPYMKRKWRILTLIVAVTSIVVCIHFRTNIIRTVFALGLLLLFRIHILAGVKWLKTYVAIIFCIPLIFAYLASTGSLSLFDSVMNSSFAEKNNVSVSMNNDVDMSMFGDTRTLIYVELLSTLASTDSYITGMGGCAHYDSNRFDMDRGQSEVGILNILLYYGVIGVALLGLLLLFVAYQAVGNSNNSLVKMIGLFIIFRWPCFFVEEFTIYDTNMFFLWLSVGIASCKTFREMTDSQIKAYLADI
jgi:hypothetical protein